MVACNKMRSILEESYKDPGRPISQKELHTLYKKYIKNLKLSNIETYHTKTGHFYLLKQNGKKEMAAKKIIADKKLNCLSVKNIGSCSVTWKLKNADPEFRDRAHQLVDEYERVFQGRTLLCENYLTHYEVELTRIFYIWLYYDNVDRDVDRDVDQDVDRDVDQDVDQDVDHDES